MVYAGLANGTASSYATKLRDYLSKTICTGALTLSFARKKGIIRYEDKCYAGHRVTSNLHISQGLPADSFQSRQGRLSCYQQLRAAHVLPCQTSRRCARSIRL